MAFPERVPGCFLCKKDDYGDAYVLWVLHDGRLVEVCSICLDRYADEEDRDGR